METSRRSRCRVSQVWAAGILSLLGVRLAAGGTDSDEPKTLPQDGLFSSIKQNIREGDQEIVRAHFEVGSPPNVHRYYCVVDPKTHRREPNGVVGDPIARPDGTTGIKTSAVSLYRCDKAEQEGMLVTTGYVVPGRSGESAATPPPTPPASGASVIPPAPLPSASSVPPMPSVPAMPASGAPSQTSRFADGMVDVSGIKLGMSPDEVRAVLRSKNLRDHSQWSENLSFRNAQTGKAQPVPNGRFISVIAASSAGGSTAAGNYEADGESFEVMFTPAPGRERAMAIVHTVGYSASNAIHETALETGLVDKYGGFADPGSLPQSATWLYQPGGTVTVGDSCGRRELLGGLGPLRVAGARENIALKRSADELQYEVAHCGMAIVTEDHHTAGGGALREDRMVTRYTITAYSPVLAAQGAAAAGEILRAAMGGAQGQPAAGPKQDAHAPDL